MASAVLERLATCLVGLIGALVVLSPFYLADAHGMLPAAIIIIMAIGPLHGLAAIKPTCLEAGAQVERTSRV